MFNDALSGVSRNEDAFNDQVKDSFGRSIDEDVFQPLINGIQQMQTAHEEAEAIRMQNQALTMELRMIL